MAKTGFLECLSIDVKPFQPFVGNSQKSEHSMSDPDIQDILRNLLITMIPFLVKLKKVELRAVSHHWS
jgi:hypothetical protein